MPHSRSNSLAISPPNNIPRGNVLLLGFDPGRDNIRPIDDNGALLFTLDRSPDLASWVELLAEQHLAALAKT